jgi:peptidoglycan biosynthesis protein MviN/MurJ (putative lipid II flippase)
MNPLGFAGLALATSAAAAANFTLLYYFSGKKAPRPDKLGLWRYSMKILVASVLAGAVAFAVCGLFRTPQGLGGGVNSLLATLISAVLAGLVFLLVCRLFKIDEIGHIKTAIFGKG